MLTAKLDQEYITLAGDRVYPDRFTPVSEDNLPCILVYCVTETSEVYDNLRLKRDLELVINPIVQGKDSELKMDILTGQIEYILLQDMGLSGNASFIELKRTEIGTDEEGNKDCLTGKLSYSITYFTPITADPGDDVFSHLSYRFKGGFPEGSIEMNH